jgi:hypothetical protein
MSVSYATFHQWTAGLLSDRAFRRRTRAIVDGTFAAARSGDGVRAAPLCHTV